MAEGKRIDEKSSLGERPYPAIGHPSGSPGRLLLALFIGRVSRARIPYKKRVPVSRNQPLRHLHGQTVA